ncbi:MAG: PadR family transcriptional regulator [Methanomassiliicoccales archaeon]
MSLQYAILGMLTYEPRTGYELKAFFDHSINFVWTAKLSQIYRELANLEDKGYVTSMLEMQEGRPDKKIYTVTGVGKQAFQDWVEKFPSSLSTAVRDEFSVHVFFGSRIDPEEITFQLKRFIKEKQEELVSLARVMQLIEDFTHRDSYHNEEFYWRLMHKRTLATCHTVINWAEDSIREIEELMRKEPNS